MYKILVDSQDIVTETNHSKIQMRTMLCRFFGNALQAGSAPGK